MPESLTVLVEQCLKAGKCEDASRFLEMASELVESKNVRLYAVEVHRLRGELLLATDSEVAETCFKRAIGVARDQGTKSLELRASTRFARLLTAERRRDEAHTMLSEIYNSFTEGFDTADLKEAKALLEELSR